MAHEAQFLAAVAEALQMALRALTTNVDQQETTLTAAVVKFRLAQVNREIAKETAA